MTARDQLLLRDNFIWAWHKVHRFYETSDVWYDELELARFESLLPQNIEQIRAQFATGSYATQPLTPLPLPKAAGDDEKPRVRQAFWVRVADQVAWVAYVNVIGPLLERAMPTWSYGNRLFRTTWYQDPLNREHLHLGPFRNAPGLVYRPFRQSWPPYRRRIYLTVRAMAPERFKREIELDEPDLQVEQQEENYKRPEWKLPYLQRGYWTKSVQRPFWASLDLERFYENISVNVVAANVRDYAPEASDITGSLLDDLLRFRLDTTGWNLDELKQMSVSPEQTSYDRIPTGLIVAGFLANTAMLQVDTQVAAVAQSRQIAHFRYVDDHVILAQSFDSLIDWIETYKSILSNAGVDAPVNNGKFQPRELKEWLTDGPDEKKKAAALRTCQLDPRFPSPLMTKTLLKVSEIAHTNFDLLDEREEQVAFDDLEHLLLTDFPEQELPAPTRVSFAATRIARIASGRFGVSAGKAFLERQLQTIDQKDKANQTVLRKQIREKTRELAADEARQRSRVFTLLVEAVRNYPEKLRLWVRVLEFCRASGHTDLRLLAKLLQSTCQESEVGCRVLRARVLQTCARQIIRCAQASQSYEEVPWRKAAAIRYLQAIVPFIVGIRDSMREPKPYETVSLRLCSAAAGIANVLANNAQRESLLPVVPFDWSAPHDPVWVWWSEMTQRTGANLQPTKVWNLAVSHLPRDSPVSEVLIRRYHRVPADDANNLYDWCNWLRDHVSRPENWFDPRASEWTALTIAMRLTDLTVERGGAMNPDQVYIPAAWRQDDTQLSWHDWNNVFNEARELTLPAPLFDTAPNVGALDSVQRLALILLALLRRDMRWPADWNWPGPEFATEGVTRVMIASARASSWTTAILEACLLPGYREAVLDLFLRPLIPADDDVAIEPLTIREPKRLRLYLAKARSVLAKLRLTVRDHQPRQLIPIHIGQLSSDDWSVPNHGDFEPEDNDD